MAKRIYLEEIVANKRIRVKERKFDTQTLMEQVQSVKQRPSFIKALQADGLSIIGEIKKASPSKGLIRELFVPIEIGKQYEGAVDAISVLTEEDYFLGKDDYLKAVSDTVSIPTLCKDFIIDVNQIYNAKILGASAVLLIVAILTNQELIAFQQLANCLNLDALVEVHTKEELDRAIACDTQLIGINNRNLKTFEIDLLTTLTLRQYVPKDVVVVSESGIMSTNDIIQLRDANIDAVLVGESFMKAENIVQHAKDLKREYKN
jgi:indole-3-glycerol phosphate synthase